MFKVQITAISLVTLQMFTAVNDFHKEIPVPVKLQEDRGRTESRIALQTLGAPKERLEKLTNGVYAASIATGIDPILIASIIPKESEWKISAKSNKGYKGLMQTPKAYMKWSMAEADIMAGSLVLKEKFQASKGDTYWALVYYKGHGGAESQKIATDQLKFYSKIKEQVNEKMKEKEKQNA